MSYRKFKLINSNNEVWEFTNQQIKSFLNSPANLGFNSNISVARYGDVLNVISEEIALPQPSGEVIFYDGKNEDRYQKYYNFCRFITYTPLKLVYTLPLETPVDYEIDCYVSSLSKTETTTEKVLKCTINFRGISFWKGETKDIVVTDSSSVLLENDGDFPVGLELTVNGTQMNRVSITLSQNGDGYGIASFGGLYEIEQRQLFDKVYVNSCDGEQDVVLEEGGSIIPNPLSYQHLSVSSGTEYVTFLKLLCGVSQLRVYVIGGNITDIEIKYTPIYRSV